MGQDILVRRLATSRSALSTARRGLPLCAVATVLLCLCAQRVSGQDRLDRDVLIKAAMVLNIAKLVTWPADGTTELTVCVLGDARFAGVLRTIEGKVVQSRHVTVTEIPEPSDAAGCQIVFIGGTVVDRLEQVQGAVSARPALTVGDAPSFAERGGAIGFTSRGNRVQIEINLATAEASGLQISSQLVRLARIVGEPRESG